MKKITCKLLLLIMTLSILAALTSCNGKTQAKIVCGVTIYEPMNYKDANGNWTGFDTEFAQLVGEKLGMKVEFQEINWDSKYLELDAGTIDCIWNGFTANSSDDGKKRSDYVDFSYGYMINQQCVVIPASKADSYKSVDDLVGKTAAVEKGSAGEAFAKDAVGTSGKLVTAAAQINTFLEVKSGAVDCAIVDILLAKQLVGTGNYSDLAIANITLDSEEYAIGFKKGSSLTAKVNQAMVELFNEGKMKDLATKYNLENSLQLDTETKF